MHTGCKEEACVREGHARMLACAYTLQETGTPAAEYLLWDSTQYYPRVNVAGDPGLGRRSPPRALPLHLGRGHRWPGRGGTRAEGGLLDRMLRAPSPLLGLTLSH